MQEPLQRHRNKSFEDRIQESKYVKRKYPDRVPVIVEPRTDLIRRIDKRKYITPGDLTLGQFMYVLRRRMNMAKGESIFLFIGGTIPVPTSTMSSLMETHMEEDGFLYIAYDFENTFG